MIVARHLYHPLPGKSAEVLKQRQLACDVRERIGLPRGRILTRVRGADGLAEVIWEWDYPDAAAYDREMEAQNASDEFMAVRRHMRMLIERMDPVLLQVAESPA
ncbi:MAG TPA: hypothetical protein VFB89_00120 [Gemmatimonadales bacterium]|nr:hypothetical protein [Gemmatimonadales bacterium]